MKKGKIILICIGFLSFLAVKDMCAMADQAHLVVSCSILVDSSDKTGLLGQKGPVVFRPEVIRNVYSLYVCQFWQKGLWTQLWSDKDFRLILNDFKIVVPGLSSANADKYKTDIQELLQQSAYKELKKSGVTFNFNSILNQGNKLFIGQTTPDRAVHQLLASIENNFTAGLSKMLPAGFKVERLPMDNAGHIALASVFKNSSAAPGTFSFMVSQLPSVSAKDIKKGSVRVSAHLSNNLASIQFDLLAMLQPIFKCAPIEEIKNRILADGLIDHYTDAQIQAIQRTIDSQDKNLREIMRFIWEKKVSPTKPASAPATASSSSSNQPGSFAGAIPKRMQNRWRPASLPSGQGLGNWQSAVEGHMQQDGDAHAVENSDG